MKYFPCWNENDPHMSWTVQMDHTVKLSDQIQKKKKQNKTLRLFAIPQIKI